MSESLVNEIRQDLSKLKSALTAVVDVLDKRNISSNIFTINYDEISSIKNISLPYTNYYYEDSDINGNKVNSYYGYIFCDADDDFLRSIDLVNTLKIKLSTSIKLLRRFYQSNPPLFKKVFMSVDLHGRINIKELLRSIVVIDSSLSPIRNISYQLEIVNKGKGRCLTASEITTLINNNNESVKYAKDLKKLRSIKHNELLSPIGTERVKCRANIYNEKELFKGKYCSLPLIIIGKPASLFKTNLDSLFFKEFRSIRHDKHIEDEPFIRFRSFSRKKKGFKVFLTEDELLERTDYLKSDPS